MDILYKTLITSMAFLLILPLQPMALQQQVESFLRTASDIDTEAIGMLLQIQHPSPPPRSNNSTAIEAINAELWSTPARENGTSSYITPPRIRRVAARVCSAEEIERFYFQQAMEPFVQRVTEDTSFMRTELMLAIELGFVQRVARILQPTGHLILDVIKIIAELSVTDAWKMPVSGYCEPTASNSYEYNMRLEEIRNIILERLTDYQTQIRARIANIDSMKDDV